MDNIVSRLEEIVGSRGLVLGDDLRSRAASATDHGSNQAVALVRPRTVEELSAVMAACHEKKQPIVIQGGMTGLVEGGRANDNELAISLELLTGIESIDPASRTITVMAGTTIQAVQEKAAEHGLLFPVDWGARGSAMVGGAIATNAGGNSVLRYGMFRDQVLGLEAVLADGTILSSMNRLMKNNTGYDLKQLFIGSEGTLGIVTKAVLRLQTAPTSQQTALVAVSSFEDVIRLLGRLQAGLGSALNAFEVMWQEHYEMIVTEGGHQWVLSEGYPYYVVVEATGTDQERDEEYFTEVLTSLMEDDIVVDAVISASHSQRESIWKIREDVDTFFRVLDPPIPFDVSVPITDMEAYVAKVKSDIAEKYPNARGTTFGHLGDGNLHFCWTTGNDDPDERAGVSKIVNENLKPYNGSISAEHGIGLAKRKYLDYSRNVEEIDWMKRIKCLFDPHNLLNPGRIIDISQPD